MSDENENHGPTLREVNASIADHYGKGWLAGKQAQSAHGSTTATEPPKNWIDLFHYQQAHSFSKNGISLYERVVCIDAPGLHGTVLYCGEDAVMVRWDDGSIGDLVWRDDVAYNAYRLQIIRTSHGSAQERDELTHLRERGGKNIALLAELCIMVAHALGEEGGSLKDGVRRLIAERDALRMRSGSAPEATAEGKEPT
jgi:hypothetical protein